MALLRLRPGRSAPGQRARDEQSAILNGLKWSIILAFLAFLALAFYSQSGFPQNYDAQDRLTSQTATATATATATTTDADTQKLNWMKGLNNSKNNNSNLVVASELFVEKNCDLGMEEWWGDQTSWKRRTPAFLIIGAKKCGTTSLHRFLTGHPSIQKARIKELLFFIPMRFPCWEDPDDYESKVLVEPARELMYQKDYPAEDIMQANGDLITFEATPDYLVYSTFSSKAILCTVPWVKIIVTLRNPVDRLFSHYSFLTDPQTGGKAILAIGGKIMTKSFDQYVKEDIMRLRRKGVIPSTMNQTESYMGSDAEQQAWREYQKIPNGKVVDRPIARSLYAIQLEGWFDALRSIGRDPAASILIVREEDLKGDGQAVSNRIFDWLGLPPAPVDNVKSGMVTNYGSQMSKETRKFLENFFDPYNRRLYNMLGKEWEGIWD